jgi:putative transposase
MSHTYVSGLVHCVFSTKNRRDLIAEGVQSQLWAFLGGIGRKNGFKAVIVGGTANHVHVLLSLPATFTLAKAMQLIKGASSHWMNENHAKDFAWQEGYGAFTVGISQRDQTISYISGPTRASQETKFRGRVCHVFEEAWSGIRPAARVGLSCEFRRASGSRFHLS